MVAAPPFRIRGATGNASGPRVAPPPNGVNPLPPPYAPDVASEAVDPVGEVGRASEEP